MLRARSVVPFVVAVASVAFGAVPAASAAGPGPDSTPPPTDPRPTVPPLTAPAATVTVTEVTAPAPNPAPTVMPQEPTGHEEGDESESADDAALSPEGRAAILAAMGLDESSLACVSSSFDPFVTDDAGAVAILQTCGVSVAAAARGAADVWVRGQQMFEVTPTTAGTDSDGIPIDDAFFVSFMFMVTTDGLECIARDLPASSTDDEALAALTACDASIAGIVSGIEMALTTLDGSTGPVPTVAGPTTTVAEAVPPATVAAIPTTAAASVPAVPGGTTAPVPSGVPLDDPGVPVVQELFAAQGIVLSAEQAACIVGGLNAVDTNNMASMAALLDSCQVF